MDISLFTDKLVIPNDLLLKQQATEYYKIWNEISDFVFEKYPAAIAEWNYPSAKYGWSYSIKDKKRSIIYLLPRDAYFKVAFVFGQKAYDEIMQSEISQHIKDELSAARIYAEGRGIRIDVSNGNLNEIKKLILVKIKY